MPARRDDRREDNERGQTHDEVDECRRTRIVSRPPNMTVRCLLYGGPDTSDADERQQPGPERTVLSERTDGHRDGGQDRAEDAGRCRRDTTAGTETDRVDAETARRPTRDDQHGDERHPDLRY